MLVEIHSLDNGSGTNSNLDVYKIYNRKQKLAELRPFCRIDEGDFFELFKDPEKEHDKAVNGKIHFEVNLDQLTDKAFIYR